MKKLNNIYDVLKQEKQFLDNEGNLFKNKVCEYARKMDKSLLKLLYNNELTRDLFFIKIDDLQIFDSQKFNNYIENKDFLPDSYTAFKNSIGLCDNLGNSIYDSEDVVLQFPYKDCILEFDSTKESDKRNEIFFNEILMKKEIDVLLDPKVLTNAKRYDKSGISYITEINDNDNLIIKGNNLLALHSLLPRYKGKIKCMYWDILYNTNNDKVPYNDAFKHSSWLTMMKNRLEIAKELLDLKGAIFIQCNDIEMAYLKVLCDEIFDRKNYINTITIKTKLSGVSGSSEGKSYIDATEFILVYAREKEQFLINPIGIKTPLYDYIKKYKEQGKSWKYTSIIEDKGKKEFLFEDKENNYRYYYYKNPKIMSVSQYSKKYNLTEKEVYEKYSDKIFRTTNAQSSVRESVIKAIKEYDYDFISLEYIPIKGKNQDQITEIFYKGKKRNMVMFLKDRVSFENNSYFYNDRINTLWDDVEYNNLSKEGSVMLPFAKKPEKLIKRVIDTLTNPGDIVLDAYLGSGTTAAVAHKMNRQYIGIEQLDSHIDKSLQRMHNVINGDQTGISENVNWQGGGSFIYCELKKLSQEFIDKVNKASEEELLSIYEELKDNQFVSYRVDINKLEKNKKGFLDLSKDKKRKFLIDIIDKNMLYVNYSDIEDEAYNISQNDKVFNDNFYN